MASSLSRLLRLADVSFFSVPFSTISVPHVSAYNLFLKEQASKATFSNDKQKFAVFSKETAEKWKSLESNEKEKYMSLAKEQNDKALAKFQKLPDSQQKKLESEAREAKEERAKRRARKERRELWRESGHPKMPTTAFMYFIQAEYAKNGTNEKVSQRAKALAEQWKTLSDKEKKTYKDMGDKDKKRYEEELAKWEAKQKTIKH